MSWIDLHLHSTASDGAYAPTKLMEMAHARQLSAIALTDHDTVAGHAEARQAAERLGIQFVPGVEVEAALGQKTVHLLGYLFDAASPKLAALLEKTRALREERNRLIADKLTSLNIDIDYEKMLASLGGRSIGRPHFAAELVRGGHVNQFRQAFSRYLGEEGAAYVPRKRLTTSETIEELHAAGGVVSLAHPSRIAFGSLLEFENLLYRLRDAGLDAIEVRHPDISMQQAREYESLAKKLGLALTGGSDFHALGAVKRGTGFSGVRIPMTWLRELENRCPASPEIFQPAK